MPFYHFPLSFNQSFQISNWDRLYLFEIRTILYNSMIAYFFHVPWFLSRKKVRNGLSYSPYSTGKCRYSVCYLASGQTTTTKIKE